MRETEQQLIARLERIWKKYNKVKPITYKEMIEQTGEAPF